jgi:hypothetical protein
MTSKAVKGRACIREANAIANSGRNANSGDAGSGNGNRTATGRQPRLKTISVRYAQ